MSNLRAGYEEYINNNHFDLKDQAFFTNDSFDS